MIEALVQKQSTSLEIHIPLLTGVRELLFPRRSSEAALVGDRGARGGVLSCLSFPVHIAREGDIGRRGKIL